MANFPLTIRNLGRMDYVPVWQAMQQFTDNREADTEDEIWVVEHNPIFTQGQAGKDEHLLETGDIPIVKVDRGGQVTYHGPGQLVVYILLNIRRRKLGVRNLVTHIENAIVSTLAEYDIDAAAKPDAPGVYVDNKKIASLGLRIRQGCSFHGLSLNVDMDLSPFLRINPCGYAGLEMVQCSDFAPAEKFASINDRLVKHISSLLEAGDISFTEGLNRSYE